MTIFQQPVGLVHVLQQLDGQNGVEPASAALERLAMKPGAPHGAAP